MTAAPALPSIPPAPADDLRAALARLPVPGGALSASEGKAYIAAGRAVVREIHAAGASGRTVVRAMTELVDRFCRAAFASVDGAYFATRPRLGPGCALVALGGYGRHELAPHSDVDLLLLFPYKRGEAVETVAERVYYALWDAGLEVGYAARSTAECVRVAAEDHTARTALLDLRWLCGDREVYKELERSVLTEVESRKVEEFIDDKIAEVRARRERFGGSVYLLEPNVKQSEGGLRDLQAALWVARARHKVGGLSDLLHRSLLSQRAVAELRAARDFLWRVRNELHYAAGRRDDRLSFEKQERIAAFLGYHDSDDGLAVEQFMRDYWLAARAVVRGADAIVDRCVDEVRRRGGKGRVVDGELKVWQGRLTVADRRLFERDPSALVRIFAVAEREGLELYSFARDLVEQEVARRGEELSLNLAANRELLGMWLTPGTRGQKLQDLHELGVLGALVPEFGRQVSRWQHDLYHVYTVDTHTVFALRRLLALRAGDFAAQEPELTRVAQAIQRPLPLMVGLFFHDLGKGGGGDHSGKGAEMVTRFAERAGLDASDAAGAEFLVRHHLLMSHTSQRRDLSDPALVTGFARAVGTLERLEMLYVLTYVDTSSVGPETWTLWKSTLLGELFLKARAALARPHGAEERGEEARAARERLAAELAPRFGEAAASFAAAVPDRYALSVKPAAAAQHLSLLVAAAGRAWAGVMLRRPARGFAEVLLTAPDQPGLLAAFAGALAAHRIDILGAEITSLADGRTLDVFQVRDPGGGPPERSRWRAARADLERILARGEPAREVLARHLRPSVADRYAPRVQTKVRIDQEASREFTVVDVFTEDRLGLVHTIAETLRAEGVSVALAKIATEGHRAADGFYVTDLDGRKIVDPARLAAVQAALIEALA